MNPALSVGKNDQSRKCGVKRIAVLGSTGSIGVNTLDVVANLKGDFKVIGLSADSNIKLLAEQARAFRPKVVSAGSEELARALRKLVPSGTSVVCGEEGIAAIASRPDVDLVVFAISGIASLVPLVEAVAHKKQIALANKESMVSAGPLIMKYARELGVRIVPIDSEHSAIFQCIDGRREMLSRIYLTGSGGPLLDVAKARFDKLPVRSILKHPRWNMGKKISVDSATMMNKGLEIIEAQYLFETDERLIEVLIHPEAIIHSMVEFADGAVFAQLGAPDMRLPIQYALTYPERCASIATKLDFAKIEKLSFRKPDCKKFPCLGIARHAAKAGGTHPAVLCASDEIAVERYLAGAIEFSDIPKVIEKVLQRHHNTKAPAMGDVLDAIAWAEEEARSICCH